MSIHGSAQAEISAVGKSEINYSTSCGLFVDRYGGGVPGLFSAKFLRAYSLAQTCETASNLFTLGEAQLSSSETLFSAGARVFIPMNWVRA